MKEKKYLIELTEKEIAIIKAGLEYHMLNEYFGYITFWLRYGCVDSDDKEYLFIVRAMQRRFDAINQINYDFGDFGGIKRLEEILGREVIKIKKESKEGKRSSPEIS